MDRRSSQIEDIGARMNRQNVRAEYILHMNDELVEPFINDSRVRSSGEKTGCRITLTRRILNRRVITSRWVKYSILLITGPHREAIEKCNRLLERHFPQYISRKLYSRKAPVTLYTSDFLIDNTNLYYWYQRTGAMTDRIGTQCINSPLRVTEQRPLKKTPWKVYDHERQGKYLPRTQQADCAALHFHPQAERRLRPFSRKDKLQQIIYTHSTSFYNHDDPSHDQQDSRGEEPGFNGQNVGPDKSSASASSSSATNGKTRHNKNGAGESTSGPTSERLYGPDTDEKIFVERASKNNSGEVGTTSHYKYNHKEFPDNTRQAESSQNITNAETKTQQSSYSQFDQKIDTTLGQGNIPDQPETTPTGETPSDDSKICGSKELQLKDQAKELQLKDQGNNVSQYSRTTLHGYTQNRLSFIKVIYASQSDIPNQCIESNFSSEPEASIDKRDNGLTEVGTPEVDDSNRISSKSVNGKNVVNEGESRTSDIKQNSCDTTRTSTLSKSLSTSCGSRLSPEEQINKSPHIHDGITENHASSSFERRRPHDRLSIPTSNIHTKDYSMQLPNKDATMQRRSLPHGTIATNSVDCVTAMSTPHRRYRKSDRTEDAIRDTATENGVSHKQPMRSTNSLKNYGDLKEREAEDEIRDTTAEYRFSNRQQKEADAHGSYKNRSKDSSFEKQTPNKYADGSEELSRPPMRGTGSFENYKDVQERATEEEKQQKKAGAHSAQNNVHEGDDKLEGRSEELPQPPIRRTESLKNYENLNKPIYGTIDDESKGILKTGQTYWTRPRESVPTLPRQSELCDEIEKRKQGDQLTEKSSESSEERQSDASHGTQPIGGESRTISGGHRHKITRAPEIEDKQLSASGSSAATTSASDDDCAVFVFQDRGLIVSGNTAIDIYSLSHNSS